MLNGNNDIEVTNEEFRVSLPGCNSWLHRSLDIISPWANYITSLYLTLHIFKIGKIIVLTSWVCGED